jgi:hypothetical protein
MAVVWEMVAKVVMVEGMVVVTAAVPVAVKVVVLEEVTDG